MLQSKICSCQLRKTVCFAVACPAHASGIFKCKLRVCKLWLKLAVAFDLLLLEWRAWHMQVEFSSVN